MQKEATFYYKIKNCCLYYNKMHYTIEIKDFTKPIRLENNTTDNRDGNLWISLKTVNFWVGYYNVRKKEKEIKA